MTHFTLPAKSVGTRGHFARVNVARADAETALQRALMAHGRKDACLRLAGIPTESVEETNHKLGLRSASVRTHVAMVAELRALQAAARTSGAAADWQAVLDKVEACRNYILAHRQLHPNVLQHMDDYDLYHMEAVDGLRQRGP